MASKSSPQMPNVVNISLTKEIEALRAPVQPGAPPPYAATELVRELLLYHISSVGHESHVNLSGQVFFRSRKVYDAINQLMDKVNNLDTLEWSLFDKYTQAIPLLEKILITFIFQDPGKLRKPIPDEDDITEGIGFIERWVSDRSMLFEALKNLRSAEFLDLSGQTKNALEEDYQSHCSRDDLATYAALANFFNPSSNRLKDNDILDRKREKPVSVVSDAIFKVLKAVTTRPPSAVISESVIKSLMLLSLPFSLLENSTKRDKLAQKTREHLLSVNVWSGMNKLVQTVTAAVGPQPTQAVLDELEKRFQELLKLLLATGTITIDTVEDMLHLIKLSVKIRRPFHDRTVALIRILRLLDEETVKANTNALGRRRLKDILQASLSTLQKTEVAVTDVKSFLLSGTVYKEQKAALSHLVSQTENYCTTHKLPVDWATQQGKFDKGVETDETHLKVLRTKFLGLTI